MDFTDGYTEWDVRGAAKAFLRKGVYVCGQVAIDYNISPLLSTLLIIIQAPDYYEYS